MGYEEIKKAAEERERFFSMNEKTVTKNMPRKKPADTVANDRSAKKSADYEVIKKAAEEREQFFKESVAQEEKIKISRLLKDADLSLTYTDKVTEILKNSDEYGDRFSYELTGSFVYGNASEIAAFVKGRLELEAEEEMVSENDYFDELYEDAEYYIEGTYGRRMWVFPDRVVIKVDSSFESFVVGNGFDGAKTIFYYDCIGIQYRQSGAVIGGFLQIETASGMMNNRETNAFGENTFTYYDHELDEDMREIYEYISSRVALYKRPPYSVADEISKYHELLEQDIISEEEFDIKKEELLSL